MKPSFFQTAIRLQFDCLAKHIIDTTVQDYHRELRRIADHEIAFSELPEGVPECIGTSDEYEDENHEKVWFIKVAMNMSKSYLRSSWLKKREEFVENMKGGVVNEKDPELWELVKQLPQKYRIVVELHFIEGYTIKEISFILKKNSSTVGTWLERGKKQLRKAMGVRGDE